MRCGADLAPKFVMVVGGLLIAYAAAMLAVDDVEWKTCNVTSVSAPSATPCHYTDIDCSAELNIPCDCGGRCVSVAPCVLAIVSLEPLYREVEATPFESAEYLCLNGAPECPRGENAVDRLRSYQDAADFAAALRFKGEIACYEKEEKVYVEVGDHTGAVVILGLISAACFAIACCCFNVADPPRRTIEA